MKGGAQTALALAAGYVLGRRRKMRMTTVLAVTAVTGGLGGLGGAALRRGVKLLGSTDVASAVGPQLGEIAEAVRGDLLDAGKAAAAAAVTSRIESLSDALHERADALRNPGASDGETADDRESEDAEPGADEDRDAGKRRGGGRGTARRRARDESDEAAEPPDDDADSADEEPPGDEDGRPARDEADEPAAGEDDDLARDDEADRREAPADDGGQPRRSRRRAPRSPVSRTGR